VDDARRGLTDGWIYGVVVNAQEMGKGLMPRYGDKIRGMDRWDVVNYVRQLQADAQAAVR
jgi:mono/diheme cytochrome c family protein